MSNIINLNTEQKRDLLTVAERLDLLEEENVLLNSDIEDLRQRLDQAQEANYLLEGDLVDVWKRLAKAKYDLANAKYRKPRLGDNYNTLDQYIDSFNGDPKRMIKAKQNWDKLVIKITQGRARMDGPIIK